MPKISLRFLQLCFFSLLIGVPSLSHSRAILTKIGSSFPMFNGADLSAWLPTGNASWQISNNEIIVNQGSGMLISKLAAPDYQIDFDYWVADNSQASIFVRCSNQNLISTQTAYEILLISRVNNLGAGSIMSPKPVVPTKVANQWNHIQISAIGSQLVVTLNGASNQVVDTRFNAGGPVAINFQAGELRLKNFNITIPGRW